MGPSYENNIKIIATLGTILDKIAWSKLVERN